MLPFMDDASFTGAISEVNSIAGFQLDPETVLENRKEFETGIKNISNFSKKNPNDKEGELELVRNLHNRMTGRPGKEREAARLAEEETRLRGEITGEEERGALVQAGALGRLTPEAAGIPQEEITVATEEALSRAGEKGEAVLVERLKAQAKAVPKPLGEEERLSREKGLRGEFTKLAKTFIDIRDSFARVQSSAKDPSAAGDLALIFNYMKMLDPGSVVRESEFANAAATGAWGERLKAAGARMLEGERLSDVMRADFVDRATRLNSRQKSQHKKREETFRSLAEDAKVKPGNVVIDLSDPRINETIGQVDFGTRLKQLQAEGKTEEEAFTTMQTEGF
jgi:hypothetical protein